jgi:hypothetical protein
MWVFEFQTRGTMHAYADSDGASGMWPGNSHEVTLAASSVSTAVKRMCDAIHKTVVAYVQYRVSVLDAKVRKMCTA